GIEEAWLAAQGVLLGWPEADGLVCDIGGASMEMAEVCRGRIGFCLSAPLGPMLFDQPMDAGALTGAIQEQIDMIRTSFAGPYRSLFLVGGSWRSIAKIDMSRRHYPLRVMNEYAMPKSSLIKTLASIEKAARNNCLERFDVASERLKLLPIAARILRVMMEDFRTDEIVVSAYGIREGVLYENMPGKLRRRDPLIEACLHAEYTASRIPGYGSVLFTFIKPLFRSCSGDRKRLIRAACILHDVSWRAHPDYRAVSCFDFATRASLGGIDHSGRVFLAFALYNRYKNSDLPAYARGMLKLLTSQEKEQAAMIGKAIRFAAMLTVGSPDSLGSLRFKPRKGELILELPQSLEYILGEVAMERFHALAAAMSCKPRVTTTAP
ncbi:MAG: exopolyphosphatase, partial [Rhodobacteraceae bacterium]|nr:exopolyphosphatase [Paracoccaceae bacterium]